MANEPTVSKALQLEYIIPATPVILNFGLPGNVDWYRQSHVIRNAMRDVLTPPTEVSIHVPFGDEEGTVILKGEFSYDACRYDALWELLVDLKEDCCAIFYPDLNEGYLFGPGAAKWQPFNLIKLKGLS